MAWFIEDLTATFGGCATGTGTVAVALNQQAQPIGTKRSKNFENVLVPATGTPLRPFAKESNSHSMNGRFFLGELLQAADPRPENT
jgi:hypothetical protein